MSLIKNEASWCMINLNVKKVMKETEIFDGKAGTLKLMNDSRK